MPLAMPTAHGRVGSQPPSLVCDMTDERTLHVTCRNNPDFSLTFNMSMKSVSEGRVPAALYEADEPDPRLPFVVTMRGDAIRIDKLGCRAFWLEIV